MNGRSFVASKAPPPGELFQHWNRGGPGSRNCQCPKGTTRVQASPHGGGADEGGGEGIPQGTGLRIPTLCCKDESPLSHQFANWCQLPRGGSLGTPKPGSPDHLCKKEVGGMQMPLASLLRGRCPSGHTGAVGERTQDHIRNSLPDPSVTSLRTGASPPGRGGLWR